MTEPVSFLVLQYQTVDQRRPFEEWLSRHAADVYFGRDGQSTIVLLCGGYKSAQGRDIKTAKIYWRDYEKRSSPTGRPV